jgi:hypothetical protein
MQATSQFDQTERYPHVAAVVQLLTGKPEFYSGIETEATWQNLERTLAEVPFGRVMAYINLPSEVSCPEGFEALDQVLRNCGVIDDKSRQG